MIDSPAVADRRREADVAKFKVVTPAGISYRTPGTVGYEYEMEALGPTHTSA